MGTCLNEECNNETTDPYKYCVDCFRAWSDQKDKERVAKPQTEQITEILTKMNWNLGSIKKSLEEIAFNMSQQQEPSKDEDVVLKEGESL